MKQRKLFQVAHLPLGEGLTTVTLDNPKEIGVRSNNSNEIRVRCANCKAATKLYQYRLCKHCLQKDFQRLRPYIDMTRQITISRYQAVTEKVPSPSSIQVCVGRGATSLKSVTNTNCGVRA